MREIRGSLPIKCNNCRKGFIFTKDKCPILAEEKDVFARLLGFENTEDLYKQTKGSFMDEKYRGFMKYEQEVSDLVREPGACPFESRFIETPLSILNGIYVADLEYDRGRKEHIGMFAKVRLASKEDTKTYLGIYLGDFPQSIGLSHKSDEQTMEVKPGQHNPALWIIELKKLVWGSGSWWSVIKSEEELKEITNSDIDNVWYMKMLKGMFGEK